LGSPDSGVYNWHPLVGKKIPMLWRESKLASLQVSAWLIVVR
jgi:hypothetical protein